jgi:hypothetical protein
VEIKRIKHKILVIDKNTHLREGLLQIALSLLELPRVHLSGRQTVQQHRRSVVLVDQVVVY